MPDHAPGATLPPRFQAFIAGLSSHDRQPPVSIYPGLRSTVWHDPQQFRLVRDLEAVADKVAAEARALPGSEFQHESLNGGSGRWSYLLLYARGRQHTRHSTLCPQTVAVIEANRDALSRFGIVYFSVLDSNTHVLPHQGPNNLRVRCHLGIDVPEQCGLRVDGMTRTWEENRCLVFDDTFTHEVWNRGSRQRIVLVVDLWHPDLTDEELILLNGLQLPAASSDF
jgi:aspartyl/asparaginyl beta-hydroxylase (cupin superfamily)